ncbi:permease [Helicobacter enhydrae]|uniref:Permease n=1 Tax=Helicobacter enhydrae TaxID=222136 RepID=A0A1B1U7H7_9HELI|nr:LptF/LptG family permease [Helicobacter enhydrae]ANV98625.1 permease [Helicobacter enhydrae]
MKTFVFISKNYLRYFLILLVALEAFFIGADSIKYADKFPDSANLIVLFFFNDALYALNYTLPLSLLLGGILFLITFLKSNQFGAMLALGFSKRQILLAPFVLSLLISCIYIALNATSFVYAQERVEAIIDQNSLNNAQEDILLKHNHNYIYFQKIYPSLNQAKNIKIFTLDNQRLKSFIQAETGVFDGRFWILKNAKIGQISATFSSQTNALSFKKVESMKILENFKPKVLDTFLKDKPTISIIDAIDSLKIHLEQGLDSTKIRAILYSAILIPLFVPLTLVIFGYFIPSLPRYIKISLLSFKLIMISLVIWGIFFSVSKFSIGGIIYPEFGILLPMIVLCSVTLYCFAKLKNQI